MAMTVHRFRSAGRAAARTHDASTRDEDEALYVAPDAADRLRAQGYTATTDDTARARALVRAVRAQRVRGGVA
jgi:hypothetical protein